MKHWKWCSSCRCLVSAGTFGHFPVYLNSFFFFLICRYEAELNPVDHQKANVLKYQMEKRPFFEMPSHLADVDLDEYDYEEDFE